VTEIVEGTVVEEPGTDLAPPAPTTLFNTTDPVEVLERATRVATALKGVIDKQGLAVRIKGREHVLVEGWQVCGTMLGVVPVIEWTRRVEGGWEARCEARTVSGQVIGAGEMMCTKSEGRPWDQRPDFALRSMAQTRATSKALSGPLRFIVKLAGYEATPAEEMPQEGAHAVPGASEKQLKYVRTLFKREKVTAGEIRAMLRGAGVNVPTGDPDPVPLVDAMSGEQASALIDFLTRKPIPDGSSDVDSDASGFEHPPADDGEPLFDPGVPS
jgi:hypothetical protein